MFLDIPELDFEDHQLSAKVHELNRAIADGRSKAAISLLLTSLLRDAVSHFSHEERILMEFIYPLPKGHAALHLQLRKELEHAIRVLRDDESRAVWPDYGLLIKQIFVEHIRQEAVAFKNFLQTSSIPD